MSYERLDAARFRATIETRVRGAAVAVIVAGIKFSIVVRKSLMIFPQYEVKRDTDFTTENALSQSNLRASAITVAYQSVMIPQ